MANDLIASTSPDYNANGGLGKNLDDLNQKQNISADGAITVKSGLVQISKASAIAATLAAPTAGSISAGGDDGKVLTIVCTTAFAHVVTTPANKINGNKLTNTFSGTLPNVCELIAVGGVWYSGYNTGGTLS